MIITMNGECDRIWYYTFVRQGVGVALFTNLSLLKFEIICPPTNEDFIYMEGLICNDTIHHMIILDNKHLQLSVVSIKTPQMFKVKRSFCFNKRKSKNL
jgi:hypothetical protein